eukprot:g5467.t1
MSLLDNSPVGKKGRYANNDNTTSPGQKSDKSGGFRIVGEQTDISCIDINCEPGKFLKKRGNKNTFYYGCNQPGCNVTASRLYTPSNIGKDDDDESGRCISCFQYVYEKLSIGKCIDESTKRYINIHALHEDCLGLTVNNPQGVKVFANATRAPAELVGQTCIAHKPGSKFKHLKEGCTGKIKESDLVVKGWLNQDTPQGLHLWCGKREWQKKLQSLIDEKKFFKAIGTTADDEAKTPSAQFTEDFADF